jgi:hypothetical protein
MGPRAVLDAVALPGLEPPIIQPVAQRSTTELSRLTEFMWFSLRYLCFRATDQESNHATRR